MDRHRNYLKFLARTHLARYYQGKVDPSDIVQQSMLQALNSSDQYHGTTEQEIKESSCVLERFLVDSQPSPSQRTWHQQRKLALANALERLPAHQKVVVVMRFWHEISPRQIAETLNEPFGTVVALLHSATKSLKASLRVIPLLLDWTLRQKPHLDRLLPIKVL